jgi:cysteine desulfuration protein SufE
LATLSDIRSDFGVLDDWEDRYRYVIELGRSLAPLPEQLRTDANKVRGCASQVWLATRVERDGDAPQLTFRSVDEILKTDADRVFAEFGLKEHLTPQRSNGLASMVARIRADALAATESRAHAH